jgi:hypothetical protein
MSRDRKEALEPSRAGPFQPKSRRTEDSIFRDFGRNGPAREGSDASSRWRLARLLPYETNAAFTGWSRDSRINQSDYSGQHAPLGCRWPIGVTTLDSLFELIPGCFPQNSCCQTVFLVQWLFGFWVGELG